MEIRKRRFRLTLFYLILLCLFIGVISTYVYTVISREMSGSRGGFLDVSVLTGGHRESIRGIRVGVLRSEQTADYLAWIAENRESTDSEGDEVEVSAEETRKIYYSMSDFWMKQLEAVNMRAELIAENTLLSASEMERFNILVLPAAYCLSDEQIDAVKRFLGRRNSVIFTHFCGNRFEDGGDRSWSLISDVVGVELSHPSNDNLKENAAHLIFNRDNPITADITPGSALPIHTFDRPVIGRIRDFRRSFPAAVWPDAANHLPVQPMERAGVVYGDYRGGRYVWFGFTSQSVKGGSGNWLNFQKLIDNSLHWVGRQPTAGRAAWPYGNSAAATIGILERESFYESSKTEDLFREKNIPYAIFFANSSSQVMPTASLNNRDLMEAALFAHPETNETLLAGEASQINSDREDYESRWGVSVSGLAIDFTDERIFKPSDYLRFNYLWALDEQIFAPELVPFGRGTSRPFFRRKPDPLVLIGQSARNYYLTKEVDQMPDADVITEALRRDFRRLREIGGLYSVTIDSTLMDGMTNHPELQEWLNDLTGPEVWNAAPGEVASWWNMYSGIKLQIRQEDARITLRMTNESNQDIPEARVYIYPGGLPQDVEIRAERMRTPIPDYLIDPKYRRIELIVREIDAHENRTYYIDF